MRLHGQGFDARFWGFTIVGTLMAGMFGCFACAISAQTTTAENASIISVNDAIHRVEERQRLAHERELSYAVPEGRETFISSR